MPESKSKAEARVRLAAVLAQHDQYRSLVDLVQKEWLRTRRRDEALDLWSLAFELILRYPDLGMLFYESFAWVETFL